MILITKIYGVAISDKSTNTFIKLLLLLLFKPLNNQPVGYFNRYTAMTIVEPWVAHRMEHTVGPLFAKTIRHTSLPRPQT
jgi:hypothetical protein